MRVSGTDKASHSWREAGEMHFAKESAKDDICKEWLESKISKKLLATSNE